MGIRCDLGTSGNMRGNMYRGVGGGSTVEITPTYNSGTKIADYSIDGEQGEIYAPTIDNLYDMSWTKVIDVMGGSYSNYVDVSSYKYIVVVYSYNGTSHEPQIYKTSDLDKILSETNDTSIGIGYQWRLGSDYDSVAIFYKNDKTLSIGATYSGIRALAYGIA